MQTLRRVHREEDPCGCGCPTNSWAVDGGIVVPVVGCCRSSNYFYSLTSVVEKESRAVHTQRTRPGGTTTLHLPYITIHATPKDRTYEYVRSFIREYTTTSLLSGNCTNPKNHLNARSRDRGLKNHQRKESRKENRLKNKSLSSWSCVKSEYEQLQESASSQGKSSSNETQISIEIG